MIPIKILIIILVFILYWIFIYYRFHYSDFTPISLIVIGIFLAIFGGFKFFKDGNVNFIDIKIIYFIGVLFLAISYILILCSVKKHGLKKKVDITMTFLNKIGGKKLAVFMAILGFPSFFFMMAATYILIGPEHIYAWGMIFLAWSVSGIRLFKYTLKPLKF